MVSFSRQKEPALILQKILKCAKHFVQFSIMGKPRIDLQISIAVRFKLLKLGIPNTEWLCWLDQRLPDETSKNRALLTGNLRDHEIQIPYEDALAGLFEPDTERLRLQDPLGKEGEILRRNLAFLLDDLGYGGKGRIAHELGFDNTSISRWLKGTSKPALTTQRRLVDYFGLPRSTDLESDPLFLSVFPVSDQGKREWLHRQIEGISSSTLKDFFPALQRLLERP